jgi:hypothetical protein
LEDPEWWKKTGQKILLKIPITIVDYTTQAKTVKEAVLTIVANIEVTWQVKAFCAYYKILDDHCQELLVKTAEDVDATVAESNSGPVFVIGNPLLRLTEAYVNEKSNFDLEKIPIIDLFPSVEAAEQDDQVALALAPEGMSSRLSNALGGTGNAYEAWTWKRVAILHSCRVQVCALCMLV